MFWVSYLLARQMTLSCFCPGVEIGAGAHLSEPLPSLSSWRMKLSYCCKVLEMNCRCFSVGVVVRFYLPSHLFAPAHIESHSLADLHTGIVEIGGVAFATQRKATGS